MKQRSVPLPPAAAAVRKQLFRATAGLTLDEQLQVAAQLQSNGASVLQRIDAMKRTTKQQKRATKANSLKFDWLHEHSHLKKLEETYSKDLESLLLRMYNDACADAAAAAKKRSKALSPEQSTDDTSDSTDNNCSSSDSPSDPTEAAASYSAASYAHELEELIKLEQAHCVALLKQVTSEREQQLAMRQLLGAIKEKQRDASSDASNQTLKHDDMRSHAQHLIFDAVIGHEMVETIIQDETTRCEQDVAASYSAVLASMREGRHRVTGPPLTESLQDEQLVAMVAALGGATCADEMLRLEVLDDFRELTAALHADLAALKLEFVRAASQPDAAGSEEAAVAKAGGWTDADDARFVAVLKSYERKSGRPSKKPELLYDQLQTVLPHIPRTAIKQHVKFHHHVRFYQAKCRDRQSEFERRHAELQAAAREKFELAARAERERQAQLDALETLKQHGAKLHARVSEWRVAKDAQERIAQQQQEIAQLLEAQKLEDDALEWRKRQERQKRLVDDYKRAKLLEELADEKLSEDELRQREAKRAAQRLVDAERVQFRHEEYQRKLEDEKQEQLRRERDEALRLAKLNAIKDETPYAQVIASIMPDPERTRQETAAFRANVEAAHEDLPVHEAGLFPTHGYDCETLFKNARFKLGLALRNAGLHTTEYARQALANVRVSNAGAYRHHVAQSTQLW